MEGRRRDRVLLAAAFATWAWYSSSDKSKSPSSSSHRKLSYRDWSILGSRLPSSSESESESQKTVEGWATGRVVAWEG